MKAGTLYLRGWCAYIPVCEVIAKQGIRKKLEKLWQKISLKTESTLVTYRAYWLFWKDVSL